MVVDIRNHVVQVKIFTFLIMVLIVVIFIKDVISKISSVLATLSPVLVISLVPIFVRVTNPPSDTRAKLTWGLGGGGF
jgi:hypothetical protein